MINFFLVLRMLFAPAPLSKDLSVVIVEAQIESDTDRSTVECPGHSAHLHHDSPVWASRAHPCFCGLWQTTANSPSACKAQQDPETGFAERQIELGLWRDQCIRLTHGREVASLTRCIIAGYATGIAGAREALDLAHTPQGVAGVSYARWLLYRAAQFRVNVQTLVYLQIPSITP